MDINSSDNILAKIYVREFMADVRTFDVVTGSGIARILQYLGFSATDKKSDIFH